MRLLLDTHFLLWLLLDPGELKPRERAALSKAEGSPFVSAISIWELRIKWYSFDRNGRRKGQLAPDRALSLIAENDFTLAELAAEDIAAALDPKSGSADPFDEMLLVHAQRLGARLLTRDRKLAAHPLSLPL